MTDISVRMAKKHMYFSSAKAERELGYRSRDPQIAIAVLVERGGRGGARAAPIAGEMMNAYFDSYGRP